MSKRVKVENKKIKLLSQEQRSASFDEEAMSANQKRKASNTKAKAGSKLSKGIPAKAARSKSASSISLDQLQTEKLQHILQLDTEDETISSIHKLLSKSRKVMVLTGAGISCNAGIPDFRSSEGLYNLVKKEHPNISLGTGKEMFDISLFRDEMKIAVWATFMEKLYSSCRVATPTKTHKFIAHLKDRGKLLRCYTQNIDGLEESLGLELSSEQPSDTQEENGATTISRSNSFASFSNAKWKNYDVVQLHGDLNTLSCTRCFHVFNWSRSRTRSLRNGELPTCPNCEEIKMRRVMQGKRLIDNNGILRPNIVLYGENHPSGDFISQGLNVDISKGRPDFFIIMGTSLKVDGVKKVVRQISKQVHERGGIVILVNKSGVGESSWNGYIDYQIWEDCDKWVSFVEQQQPDFFKSQKEVDRLRLLKREASELRKQKLLEKKKQKEQSTLHTPPTTPTRSLSPNGKQVKKEESPLDDSIKEEKRATLRSLKRSLISPVEHYTTHKKQKIELKETVVSESDSDSGLSSVKSETVFEVETKITT